MKIFEFIKNKKIKLIEEYNSLDRDTISGFSAGLDIRFEYWFWDGTDIFFMSPLKVITGYNYRKNKENLVKYRERVKEHADMAGYTVDGKYISYGEIIK